MGHKDNAEFALAMCPTEPFVLSGGWNDATVVFSCHFWKLVIVQVVAVFKVILF